MRAMGLSRSSFRYESERRAKDEELTATLKTLALEQPRYGYRRLAVDTSIPSAQVIRELEAAIAEYGKPRRIRMDNGSELASREFQAWCIEQKIGVVHIRPGKPVENAYCESFNGRLSEEFLNTTQLRHLSDTMSWAGTWYKHYNQDRPHSSLDYRTPSKFAAQTLAYEAKQLYDLAAT